MTDIEKFIKNFLSCGAHTPQEKGALIDTFTKGYCWHFAHLLRDTFNRGTVVLAAPFGHACFQDIDGKVYDITGEYDGEAYYFIPEEFAEKIAPGCMEDFKHVPGNLHSASREECISIMREYCKSLELPYDEKAEKYLW